MKRIITFMLFFSIFCLHPLLAQTTTFDVKFVTSVNDGSNLKIDVQVRGNNLPTAKTLNSATLDVTFSDASASGLLTFVNATDWAFTVVPEGYTVMTASHTGDNNIRITILAGLVDGTTYLGHEVSSTYETWVSLNFTHSAPTGSADFSVKPATAAISLFDNVGNAGGSGDNTEYNPPDVVLNNLNVDPLPVELTSFSANSVEGTKAQLKWETATEVNNYGFEVERRVVTDETSKVKGEKEISAKENSWEKVGFIEGHGNSNSPKLYSFTDKNLIGGSKFMYRLKQVDIDGTFEYSDEVEVEVLPNKYELYQNYPNPFNPSTNIKFSLPEDAKVAINIYNVLGERVGQLLNEDLKAGFHQVAFSANSVGYQLASGVYLYTIESKNFTQVKKMILMK